MKPERGNMGWRSKNALQTTNAAGAASGAR